jgi:cell fate (sporulation/competence/biofilm development) regulator YlbF (YheA/YmcA/DUF963 family)
MINKIDNALNTLLDAIKDDEVSIKYNNAKKKWSEAKESQELLADFMDARNTFRIFKQGGFPGLEEQKEKMKNLYEGVKKDKNIQEWTDAQEKYQQFIWDQAQYLSDKLGINFGPKPKSCCG